MATKQEIETIINWCEEQKRKQNKIVLVVRNPFREQIPWTYRYPLIEIDRPTSAAAKSSLVYDSSTRTLWHYYFDEWRKIEPEAEIFIR